MASAPETRESLILRIADAADAQAWEEFVAIYRPVITRLALARGLQHADAEDLAQQVLLAVAGRIGEWQVDPDRARFSTWLRRVVRNAAINAVTRTRRDRGEGGTTAVVLINGQPANDVDVKDVFDLEARRELFRRAADHVREEFEPATWAAFWLTAVEGRSGAEAANQTGKSIGAVYVAKSRVMSRIQETLNRFLENDSWKGQP